MSYEIGKWLTEIAETESPLARIVAFNIGLFESEEGYTAYLSGSKDYDANNDDWACNEDFVPHNKYFKLRKSSGKEWQQLESEVVDEVKDFLLSETAKKSFFTNAKAITVGFDDGELVKVNA